MRKRWQRDWTNFVGVRESEDRKDLVRSVIRFAGTREKLYYDDLCSVAWPTPWFRGTPLQDDDGAVELV